MNQNQLAQQIRYLLGARKWADDSNNSVVFGSRSVVVSELPMVDLAALVAGNPFAAVRLGAESFDAGWPDIASIEVTVEVAARIANDRVAQASIIGGVRPDFTASQGAGVGELMAEVKAELKRLETAGGVSILSQISGAAKTQRVGLDYWVSKALTITARGHAEAFYHPARGLSESSGTLSWTNAPDRFDRLTAVLRYASGSTAPASPTAGSGATLTDLATSYVHGTDGQGSGTFSYALFSAYNPRGASSAVFFGDAVTLTASF